MILAELFLLFAKFSYCGFGGLSMLPMTIHDLTIRGWMSLQEITDFIAIAEMTPGSFTINVATFCGLKVAGIPGALFASLGAMMPSLTIAMGLAAFLVNSNAEAFKSKVLYYVRPAALGTVMYVTCTIAQSNLAVDGRISWFCAAIAAGSFAVLTWRKISIPIILLCAAVVAIIIL